MLVCLSYDTIWYQVLKLRKLVGLRNISSRYSSEYVSLFDLIRLVLMQVVLAVCFVSVTCMKVSFVWGTVYYWYWITRDCCSGSSMNYYDLSPDLSFPIRVLLWSLRFSCVFWYLFDLHLKLYLLWSNPCLFPMPHKIWLLTYCHVFVWVIGLIQSFNRSVWFVASLVVSLVIV